MILINSIDALIEAFQNIAVLGVVQVSRYAIAHTNFGHIHAACSGPFCCAVVNPQSRNDYICAVKI
jgi:hypothetical protein